MKNVLVTGGAGFIGSHVVDLFISNGYQVVIADNLSTGKMENVNQEAVFYNIDICDRETLDQIFKEHKINFVVHLAAQVSVGVSMENPILDTDINVIGTVNLLECCRKFAIKKFIYSSSAAIYGEPQYLPIDEEHPRVPQSFYGLSKDIGEKYIEMYSDTYGVDYTILRYSNVYGPRQDSAGEGGVVAIFTDRLLNNEKPVIFGDGKQTRDFIFVGDVAMANFKALFKGSKETVNISTGSTININELFDTLKLVTSVNLDPEYHEERKGDIKDSCLDNTKAKKILEWEPQYTLKDGLAETVQYFKELKINGEEVVSS